MINRRSAETIDHIWQQSKLPELPPGQRLEFMLLAFQMLMQEVINDADSVQRFWDSTGMMAALLQADDAAGVAGGTIRKDSLIEYQALFLSFRQWIDSPVSTEMPTPQQDGNGNWIKVPVTLDKTPAQLLMQQPQKVATPIEGETE